MNGMINVEDYKITRIDWRRLYNDHADENSPTFETFYHRVAMYPKQWEVEEALYTHQRLLNTRKTAMV